MASNPQENTSKKSPDHKKKWIVGSALLLAILTLLGITMGNTLLARFAPDKFLLLSLGKMHKLIEKENKDTLISLPDHRRVSTNLNLKDIQGLDDDYMEDLLANSGLSLSLANSQDKDILIDANMKKNAASLLDISIFSSEEELGVKIPGLLDQYLTVDLRNLAAKLNQSILSNFIGQVEEDEVRTWTDSIDQLRMAIIGDFGQLEPDGSGFSKEGQEALVELVKNADVSYEGRAKVLIDQKEKKANKISVLIDSSHMQSFAQKNLYEGLDQVNFSDLEMDFIIDNKRRIISTQIHTSLSQGPDKIKVTMDYTLSGGHSLFDQTQINVRLNKDEEIILLSLEKDKSYSDNQSKTSQTISLEIKEDSQDLLAANLIIQRDLKSESDNFSLTGKMTFDGQQEGTLILSGDLLADPSNHFLSLDAKKIELDLQEAPYSFSANGSGSFEIADIKDQSLALSENQQLDLFSLGVSQIFDIMGRIGSQLYNFNLGDFFY